jgi:hypothetical protein
MEAGTALQNKLFRAFTRKIYRKKACSLPNFNHWHRIAQKGALHKQGSYALTVLKLLYHCGVEIAIEF